MDEFVEIVGLCWHCDEPIFLDEAWVGDDPNGEHPYLAHWDCHVDWLL